MIDISCEFCVQRYCKVLRRENDNTCADKLLQEHELAVPKLLQKADVWWHDISICFDAEELCNELVSEHDKTPGFGCKINGGRHQFGLDEVGG